jgi:hypothetical protein
VTYPGRRWAKLQGRPRARRRLARSGGALERHRGGRVTIDAIADENRDSAGSLARPLAANVAAGEPRDGSTTDTRGRDGAEAQLIRPASGPPARQRRANRYPY